MSVKKYIRSINLIGFVILGAVLGAMYKKA